jgi:DNA-binding PadR family transcriptional regulator
MNRTMNENSECALSDLAFHILLALGEGRSHGYAIGKGPGDTDERRKYFALTPRGRRAAGHEARRLEALVRTARRRKLYPQRA